MRQISALAIAAVLLMGAKPAPTADQAFRKLLDDEWTHLMTTYPEWATWVGYAGRNARWTDMSVAAIEKRQSEERDFLKRLRAVPRTKLSAREQLNYDLAVRKAELSIEGFAFRGELMPINQMGGIQQDAAQLLSMQPSTTVQDYEDILARLRTLPQVIEQTMALMATGLAAGLTPPQVILRDVPDQIMAQIVDDPLKAPALEAFTHIPTTFAAADTARLSKAAADVYTQSVAPAFRKLHTYFKDTYLPKTRTAIGLSALPNGTAWYAHAAKESTTTTLTPEAIHALGQNEVKRIRAAMDQVIKDVGFDGDFAAFTGFLRTDEQFFFKDAENLLVAYRDIAKRADPELIKLFGKLPRLPYAIKPVPSYAEKSQTTAYYNSGSEETARPGIFYANTYDLKSRPKWEMEALTLHEAVPGHHLQISLAQEQQDVPEFRKHDGYTAYVEGWGLYSESLGTEMGFYKDPYSKFGQLTYEMWRAVRLVVDTGMHALGWTREQATEFFRNNTGKTEHDIIVEVDRYIAWPGQALAYKIGELKIKELRAYATKELGPKFDVRGFHDQLLVAGALPLDVLEERTKAWVAERKRAASI